MPLMILAGPWSLKADFVPGVRSSLRPIFEKVVAACVEVDVEASVDVKGVLDVTCGVPKSALLKGILVSIQSKPAVAKVQAAGLQCENEGMIAERGI